MKEHFFLPKLMDRRPQLDRIEQVLERLPADKSYRVEVHEQSNRRSEAQNRYLWGCVYPSILQQGGEALAGWMAEDLHEYCLGECFGWERVKALGATRQRPIRRSSRLSKTEFGDYIAFIQRRMSEHGINVPDPDPEWDLKEDAA